jgi:hypothetical protein
LQLIPAPSEAVHWFVLTAKLLPVTCTELIEMEAAPLFVNVTLAAGDVDPTTRPA